MFYASGIFSIDQDCIPKGANSYPTQGTCAKEVDHAMLLVKQNGLFFDSIGYESNFPPQAKA